jgi:hypothetical protein
MRDLSERPAGTWRERLPLYEVRYRLADGGTGAMKVAARFSGRATDLVKAELPKDAVVTAVELIAAGK